MKVKKRKKNSRIRGARTCGWGFRQKHKGHGNKGGVGMAGSGKKADHKKQKARSMDPKGKYFGRSGLTSRKSKKKGPKAINLKDIRDNFFSKEGETIELKGLRILGSGEGFSAKVIAKSATKSAIEKMKKAGGEIILEEKAKNLRKDSKKEGSNSEKNKGTDKL
ncbi:hypothetical protein D6829_02205 [Candidatus Pacearchaeota archaeon]|nr:MAG: hypothetical protein D6829_02205 [Candidatus Pacearchaeota archaeon]